MPLARLYLPLTLLTAVGVVDARASNTSSHSHAALLSSRAVTPVVRATTSYGNLADTGYNRDSCTSTAWYGDNVLWTCRDTQTLSTAGVPGNGLVVNTGAWSGKPSGTSAGTLTLRTPQGYGPLFYPLEGDECPTNGACSDGTRWVGWPDTGPAVVFSFDNDGFIKRQHLSGLSLINTPDTTLYHVSQNPVNTNAMPQATVDTSKFWASNQVGYGTAATVLNGSYVYLYGSTPNGQLAVARSALTGFLGALNSKSTYQYYVNGGWTASAPTTSTAGIALANTRGNVQGTVYFSAKWNSFVWIGGDGFPNANFYVSTAPAPEGPWTVPTLFYSGAVGTGSLAAYSAVAHPALTDGTGNYIFITWTKTAKSSNGDVYTQPLVRVDWA
ncbi:hypothetical protein MIND_01333800 [Mycena indigotica]|uniref:DUF4185 domain-containing protein n=1 Tax=Mycena indigotica TaxID=2126181 RepID=A0A8H6S088_9AGAR|nr:uncharacterized protein MIND_01333800 [Mycena indigotica]KAF7290203.1 hypothetical protein MIND_01333800 [Mycena indigotica]